MPERDTCVRCGENATVPGKLARRCGDCLDEMFGLDETDPLVDDVLETLTRIYEVEDAGRYDGAVEVMLKPDVDGVPLFVPHYLAEAGLRITDVSPQGEPHHLIVRAE